MPIDRRKFIATTATGTILAASSAPLMGNQSSGAQAPSNKLSAYNDSKIYAMPAHFGGRDGGISSTTYWDTDTASVFYETEYEPLARLLPPGFTLLRAELMVAFMMNRGVEWMGGEPYNIVAVNAPVKFEGTSDKVEGWFSLVVWENNTTPILTGREGTGIPKIPSEIEDFRFHKNEMRTWAHAKGHTFCHMHLSNIAKADAPTHSAVKDAYKLMNWMGWRYIPAINPKGGAALSEPTLYPQEFYPDNISIADGTIEWSVPPVWQNPTQHHIIAQLAGLRVGAPASRAIVIRNARNVLRGDLAKTLE